MNDIIIDQDEIGFASEICFFKKDYSKIKDGFVKKTKEQAICFKRENNDMSKAAAGRKRKKKI